ncbi:hypothetical protein DH86_00001438, partial [Scytalidium sp. 3C]
MRQNTNTQSTRKGHKKSRKGCFNCKARKVKCQETHPCCENCYKRGLDCQYPLSLQSLSLSGSSSTTPNSVSITTLQSTPTLFTPTDMQLFYHFLHGAYPHLPVGND